MIVHYFEDMRNLENNFFLPRNLKYNKNFFPSRRFGVEKVNKVYCLTWTSVFVQKNGVRKIQVIIDQMRCTTSILIHNV